MTTILIQKTKYDDIYLDASTPEKMSLAFLAVLKTNYFYYSNPEKPYFTRLSDEDTKLAELTQEQIDDLPEVVRETIVPKWKKIHNSRARAIREFEEEKDFYSTVTNLLAMDPAEAALQTITRTFRSGQRKINLAKDLVDRRADYEYEGYEILNLTEPMSVLTR